MRKRPDEPDDPNRPYPNGVIWDEAYRQRLRADGALGLLKEALKIIDDCKPDKLRNEWYVKATKAINFEPY